MKRRPVSTGADAFPYPKGVIQSLDRREALYDHLLCSVTHQRPVSEGSPETFSRVCSNQMKNAEMECFYFEK